MSRPIAFGERFSVFLFISMSGEELAAFLEAVKVNQDLLNKLNAAKSEEDVVALAREAGFVITVEHLQHAPISDEELEAVSAGGGGSLYEGGIARLAVLGLTCYGGCN